ncbi:MAG: methyltransferase domain-containing protein [Cystobacterineae bacterium]|nr:methyltransferase domain-containing protein [Cystobacterineae bacterium]
MKRILNPIANYLARQINEKLEISSYKPELNRTSFSENTACDSLKIDAQFLPEQGVDIGEKMSFYNNFPENRLRAPYVCSSQLCNTEFFGLPLFQYWMKLLKISPRIDRKHWEYVYITQALYENGMLTPGKRGLGFACGKEPLPALFASMGCEILATDLDINDARSTKWVESNQNTMNAIEHLNERDICPPDRFAECVNFRSMDMNEIPKELFEKFDFNWSSCAVEHIGGMEKSMHFLTENLKTLKSGGIAVHTFEFNLSSNDDTCFLPDSFIFRKCDVENATQALRTEGHEVYPLDFKVGTYLSDSFIDTYPYMRHNAHLRLVLEKYIATSFGFIVRKGQSSRMI